MNQVQNQSRTQRDIQIANVFGVQRDAIRTNTANGINNNSASQAERRGFDPRLPLQSLNNLAAIPAAPSPKQVQNPGGVA